MTTVSSAQYPRTRPGFPMIPRLLRNAAILVCLLTPLAAGQVRPVYKDPARPIDERVNDLLGRMTIEEKFWQLFMIPGDLSDGRARYKNGIFGLNIRDQQRTVAATEQMLQYKDAGVAAQTAEKINSIQKFFVEETRLGIPIIAFDEALHGLVRNDATAFPQCIGLAATWDTAVVGKVGAAIGREARSRGIRDVLCPVINLARDVRWGRVEETFGEDPFLMSEVTAVYVRSIEELGVVVTPKHLIANVGDGGRDSYPIDFNERTLEEVYLPPFVAALKRGRVSSFMTSYNSLDGSPCTANPWLLKEKVKKEWGFDGFIISDASAVGGLLDLHHIVGTRQGSAKAAIEGGLDVIFQTAYEHHEPLLDAFRKGMVDPAAVDDAVRRVLRAKFRLGLFEHPYVDPAGAKFWSGNSDHRALALRSALESIVLLKNDRNVLPLNGTHRSIAVIGPDAVEARLGGYSGSGIRVVSILDGIRERVGATASVRYVPGCGRLDTTFVTVPPSVLITPEGRRGLRGEYFNAIDLSGSPVVTRTDQQVDFGWTLFSADPKVNFDWFSVRWTGTLTGPSTGTIRLGVEGDDGYRLYLNDSLIIDRWQKRAFATTTVPVTMVQGSKYAVRLEFHEGVGNVRVRLVWDAGVVDKETAIREAVAAAEASDIAIVVAGLEEGEFRDRSSLALPGRQEELIRRITATHKPVIVIIVGGSAVTMAGWLDQVGAVLDVWYPGEQGGAAVADVLFGDYSPAGRLPITFPDVVGQAPLYYNHKPTGRGDDYMDHTGKPLFPFGYGLSYTTFAYSGLRIAPDEMKPDKHVVVYCTVKNTGAVAGDEVVQLYIRDMEASVTRPVMELRGFTRVSLAPGEWKDVRFDLGFDELSMLDAHMKRVVEPGDIKIMIGSSSADIRLRGFVRVLSQ
jgi:beta-glucosidase